MATEETHSLLKLGDDTLCYICCYLKISDLEQLQQVNQAIFNIITTSSACVISLNYPEWNKLNDNSTIDTLSCIKQLYLNNINIYKLPTTLKMQQIMNQLIKLSVNSVTPYSMSHTQIQCKSLQSLTTYSMKYDTILQFLKYIDVNINSLKELQLNGVHITLTPQFTLKLFNSNLIKLSVAIGFIPKRRENYQIGLIEQYTKSNANLWKTLRYFSCKKPTHNIKNKKKGLQCEGPDHITILCRKIISYCDNLEYLELINMHSMDYVNIFGVKIIKLNCKKLKQLILHFESTTLSNILRHLFLSGNIILETIDLVLVCTDCHGSTLLNNLKYLLILQLSNSLSLRDIILHFQAFCGHSDEVYKWKQISLLYSMLIEVFQKDCIQFRKELNIKLSISYHAATAVKKGRTLEIDKILQLMDVLNKKVECCTVFINICIFDYCREWKVYRAFLYHLQCNHEWITTRTAESQSDRKHYNQYKLTNYVSDHNKIRNDEDNISLHELRINYENKQDVDGNFIDDEQILDTASFCNYCAVVNESEVKNTKKNDNEQITSKYSINDNNYGWKWNFDDNIDNNNNTQNGFYFPWIHDTNNSSSNQNTDSLIDWNFESNNNDNNNIDSNDTGNDRTNTNNVGTISWNWTL